MTKVVVLPHHLGSRRLFMLLTRSNAAFLDMIEERLRVEIKTRANTRDSSVREGTSLQNHARIY